MIALVCLCSVSFASGLPAGTGSPRAARPLDQEIEEALPNGQTLQRAVTTLPDGREVNHGKVYVHDADGVRRLKGTFTEGRRSGKWKWYGPGRSLRAQGLYREGVTRGEWTLYHADGSEHAEGELVAGRMVGRWTFRTPDGRADRARSGEYRWREGAVGELTARGYLLDDLPHGRWWLEHEREALRIESRWLAGRPASGWRVLHPDGSEDALEIAGDVAAPDLAGLLGFLDRSFPGELVGQGDPDDPGGDEPPPPAADAWPTLSEAERSRVENLLDMLTTPSHEQQDRAQRELLQIGPRILPAVLRRWERLDPSRAGDRHGSTWYEGFLARLLDREPHPSTPHPEDGSPVLGPEALRQWRAFVALAGQLESLWNIDLELPTRGVPLLTLIVTRAMTELEPPESTRTPPRKDPLNRRARAALEAAADWLVAHQDEDGGWHGARVLDTCEPRTGVGSPECADAPSKWHDTGLTGLACLVLVASGAELEGGPRSAAFRAGVAYLLRESDSLSGRLAPEVAHEFLYSHAIAGWALARSLEGTRNPALRKAARRATDFALDAQNPYGAWRYTVPPNNENDTSITGWMIRFLVEARRQGLAVPGERLEWALAFLDEMTDGSGSVGYQERFSSSARTVANQHFPTDASEALAATTLACRLLLGQDPDRTQLEGVRILQLHAARLLEHLPEWDPEGFRIDMYYWFHGSEALCRLAGSAWKRWDLSIREALIPQQRDDGHLRGSWDPVGAWGGTGGRIYATAIAALALSAPAWVPNEERGR